MYNEIALTVAEEKLANLIWEKRVLTSPELVMLAEQELGWKKSTTYTILKKLCDKGVFKNERANISVVLTKDEQLARQSRQYVEDIFGGSLPKFITAFFGGKKLTAKQADELKAMIDNYKEGDNG